MRARTTLTAASLLAAGAVLGWLASLGPVPARAEDKAPAKFSDEEVRDFAVDAYIYASPPVLMGVTRRVWTKVEEVVGLRDPMNQIVHARVFPNARKPDGSHVSRERAVPGASLEGMVCR
jgi:hypothetical protein